LESSTRLVNENKAKRSGHQYQKKHLKIWKQIEKYEEDRKDERRGIISILTGHQSTYNYSAVPYFIKNLLRYLLKICRPVAFS
jgi:hypothetical protein